MTGDASRACLPDEVGTVDSGGVRIAWERYGEGDTTVLLLPTWSLVHSRVWKAQVPFLARHFRVLVFDPRGNGRSDRPHDPALMTERCFAQDALAVLDATGTQAAVVVSLSSGAQRALLLCAEHPDRVLAAAFIAPWFPASRLGGLRWRLMASRLSRRSFGARPLLARSWLRFNARHMLTSWASFAEWFVRRTMSTPHSTKQVEDALAWALEADPVSVVCSVAADRSIPVTRRAQREAASRLACPVVVISAPDDRVTSHADARELAAVTGGELVVVPEGGHNPNARKPVPVNLALARLADPQRRDTVGNVPDGRPRALFVSSPIGLGHAQRDVAIARELRRLVPDLVVDWLAQDPVTRVLAEEGERLHPASRFLANESRHIESESAEHDLHCFQAWRRMDEILVANFMVFSDVVRETPYDLWVADEGWDIDYFLHENPGEKRAPYAWLTDFVGWLPMPDGGTRERALTSDYNAEMVELIARRPEVRDRALFVGNPEDCVPDRLGPGLPGIREWTQEHFDFTGYVTGFDPGSLDREALRAELGYRPDERVCLVSVGGSGVGEPLLRRVVEAFPTAKAAVPDLRMVVVAGPRIDPAALPQAPGLEVRSYVHNLYRHLAVCDLAVVQGGLTTAMELTAAGVPFLYFPLQHHFEQRLHVAHRLDRYGAGRRMDYETTTAEQIAAAVAEDIGRPGAPRPGEPAGPRRAAARLAELL